eukprot:SAG31_NODE_2882_length_4955_cov_22.807455_1_plen_34_part_00
MYQEKIPPGINQSDTPPKYVGVYKTFEKEDRYT